MKVPERLLVYYGWLNSFNSATNGWDNKKVAKELAKYNLIVLGDGLADSAHGDYSNTKVIINRINDLNGSCKIFGYVTVNQTFANFKTAVDKWLDNSDFGPAISGIFFDEAGYDFGSAATNSREQLNLKIQYIKSKQCICFINAWKIEHIFGNNTDVSYPDSTWNASDLDILLDEDDYYLMESHAVDSAGAYESKTQWYDRGIDSIAEVICKIASVSVIKEDDAASDNQRQAKFDFIQTSASMWGYDAFGTSAELYGASNGKSKMWLRDSFSDIVDNEMNIVINDDSDNNVYYKYFDNGRMLVDFTSSSENSDLEVY